jgi:catechol 2,3-dioxygenase-like lactoylglutathione lyase family enzyme
MITALDHIVLLCPDLDEGVEYYRKLFGADPVWRAAGEGSQTAVFDARNTTLELMAPHGEGAVSDKLQAMTQDGPRLTSLAYRSDAIGDDHYALGRRGLAPSEVADGASEDLGTGQKRSWKRFRLPDQHMAGIKSFVLELTEGNLPSGASESGAITALDHIVINTPNPERAVATYGARLGLRFALDRLAEQWKTRFLFFRLGDLTLEIIHRLDQDHNPDDHDSLWGITWAVEDLGAAHARLGAAGLNISEIRQGRKPGSHVFTVRDGTLSVPTLFIQHDKK